MTPAEQIQVEEDKKLERVEEQQADLDPDDQNPGFVSVRDPEMKTAEENSKPHPEIWPAPSGDLDSEAPEGIKAEVYVRPERPSANFEYVIYARGLPINRGLTWSIQDPERPEALITHKSDGQGECSVVWRTQVSGKTKVKVHGRERDGSTGKSLATATVEVR